MTDEQLLGEQLDYYRARAHEYDEWWERRGRYDRGEDHNRQWRAEIADVREVFDALPLEGEVIELAPGTGYWTELLVDRGAKVTALDGSTEMIDVNRARLGDRSGTVDYQLVNLFDWVPGRRWDAMVFCFWISHVPIARLAAFLRTCRRALEPGATVFFLDQQTDESTAASDHRLPDISSEIMIRKLNDGREFRIVKNFHDPQQLVQVADAAGLDIDVDYTDNFFLYGTGRAR